MKNETDPKKESQLLFGIFPAFFLWVIAVVPFIS